IGFSNIHYILIDDASTDSSRKILLEYANKYSNITVVFLEKNSGTPAKPRNIGISLSKSKYITFLDADDWFSPNGLEKMYKAFNSNTDYVVGKTIKVESGDQMSIVGEHQSCIKRVNVSPFTIPHIFHHLGPTARMIRSSIIKKNNIKFP